MAADPGNQRQSQIAPLGTLCSRYSSREYEAGVQCMCGMWLHIPTFPLWTTTPTKNQSIFRLYWVTWPNTTQITQQHYQHYMCVEEWGKKKSVINFILTEAAQSQLGFLSTPQAEWWSWSKTQTGLIEGLLESRSQTLFPNIPIPYPCSHLYSTSFSSEVGGGHSPCRFSHNLNSSLHTPSFVQRMGS